MKKILVLGLGKFGHRLVEVLAQNPEVRLIAFDRNNRLVESVTDLVHTAASGNLNDPGTLDAVLAEAGHLDAAVVSLGDAFNTTTLMALHLRQAGVRRIFIKADDPSHGKVLEAIDKGFPGERCFRVLIPELDAAEEVAHRVVSHYILKDVLLAEGFVLAEMLCPEKLAGTSLAQLDLRKRYQLTVIGWREAGGQLILASPATPIPPGCTLTVVGSQKDLRAFEKEFGDS